MLFNEGAFLENCFQLQGFPIRKIPTKGHLNLAPKFCRVLVQEFLTVSGKLPAKTRQM